MTIHAALDRASSYVLICFDRQKLIFLHSQDTVEINVTLVMKSECRTMLLIKNL